MRGREWVAVTTGSANVTEETLKSKEQSEVESEKVDMVSSSLLSSLSLAASLPLVKRLASVGCDGKDTLEKGEVPGRSRLRTALLAEVSTKSKPSVDRMCSILTERKVKMEKGVMEKVMMVCPFQRQGPCVRFNERKSRVELWRPISSTWSTTSTRRQPREFLRFRQGCFLTNRADEGYHA